MDIFGIFTLLGGVAMFLYGMSVMGDGLEKLGGGRFERILERLTDNPFKGVALGAAVTALVQSSSATTVMVVGFVNSGIMKLRQAVGIIMGANVGTTITAWILSLTGIQGDSFLLNILKPENFTPVLAVIGIILYMAAKSDKMKNIGSLLIGFSVLMFGMETMSNAVKPLADVPEFTGILAKFQNPILGVIAGAVLTGIIQSSAASVGILQALSMTGQITFGAAIPIIMGQNIGTCVTALLSCVGANKNAKRAAMIHLYFNIIGTILFLIIFYAANSFMHFSFVDNTVSAFNIAVVHTVFNIMATAVLLPFRNMLVKLAEITVKGMKEQFTDESILDERFLQTPAYAVEQCNTLTINMGFIARETFEAAVSAMRSYTKEKDKLVSDNEKKTDRYEDSIGAYLVKLSAKDLNSKDSQKVSQLLHTIGDFEQITDYAKSILFVAREINEKGIQFSEKAQAELDIITSAISQILDLTVTAFSEDDLTTAMKVEPLEEVVDVLRTKLKNRHIRRLQTGKCTIEMGFIFSDYISSLEKISDHCLNIALYQTQNDDESYELHQYMKARRKSDTTYKDQYNHYSRKYALPFSASETKQDLQST